MAKLRSATCRVGTLPAMNAHSASSSRGDRRLRRSNFALRLAILPTSGGGGRLLRVKMG